MSSTLLIERQGAVETWTMNDPATRNALSDAVVDGLQQACAHAAQDPSLRIVVLTGASGAFCAGGSLGGFASLIGQPLQEGETDPLLAMNRGFGDLLHTLSALPQLLVCRVDGAAMGGGFGLVCCADHVVATARSVLGTPEVTLGLPPAQMDTDAAWQKTLTRLMRAAPGAVASTKQLLRQLRDPVPDLRDAAAQAFAQGLRSTEAAQGLAAFARKQPAPWTLSGKDPA
jgi:isohexenylglutaconyl-CoA hydratase